ALTECRDSSSPYVVWPVGSLPFRPWTSRDLRVAALQAVDDVVEDGLQLGVQRQKRADHGDRDKDQDQAVLDHSLSLLAAKPGLDLFHMPSKFRVELHHFGYSPPVFKFVRGLSATL